MRVKLLDHQQAGLERTKDFNKVAYFWDMGLGKTFIGSEKLKAFDTRYNLVVCQLSKVQDWYEHFKQFYPEYNTYIFKDKVEPGIAIINYDKVFRRDLSDFKDFTLMLDESSLIQNEMTNRAKTILKMDFKNIILLSGTPVNGKYEKLWSQSNLLGWPIDKKTFMTHYCEFETIDIPSVGKRKRISGYKNVERLKKKLRSYGADFLLTDEVVDLPTQTFIDVKIPKSKNLKKFEKEKLLITKDKEYVGDTGLAFMLYQRILCSSSEKLQALKDIIDSTSDRLVIFYNFYEELNQILTVIDRPVSIVNGQQRDQSNYDDNPDGIILVNYKAGAKGINLQKGNKIIFYSPTVSPEDYMQSKKRIHRIGQEKPCFYYKFITENSIENKVYRAVERGEEYTLNLFEKGE